MRKQRKDEMMGEMESVGEGVASYLQLFLLHLELISVILPPVTARELCEV